VEAPVSKDKLEKTNAARILDGLGVPYELRAYAVDEDDLSAESVARKVGLPEAQVFKTLVVRGERTGVCFAVIPAGTELDLKALARARGDKSADVVPLKEVLGLTGYIRGGVTVLGAKKDYPVVIDETAILFDVISVSAGQRGLQLFVHPEAYAGAVSATWAAIAR
jgi:Cys-tRNA(Pro)/Cys-tRNA(Cys) deacylase